MNCALDLWAVVSALEEADALLFIDDGVLCFDAPHGSYTPQLREMVAAHRAELTAKLSTYTDSRAMVEDLRERWNERAAILQHEAGLSRDEAELAAWLEVSQ